MKKILIICLLLLFCNSASATGLRFVGTDDNGGRYFLDKGSLSYISIFDETRPENNKIRGCYYELIYIKKEEKMSSEIVQTLDDKGRLICRILFLNVWVNGQKRRCLIDAPDWQGVSMNDEIQDRINRTISEYLHNLKDEYKF
ncbi:MAG: hypothetical protein DBY32_11240 [Phascolarctobacterium sp.]|nr:MAG: hypothetical protein DBY32_11240 [Phascolarctobacterium sp.]